MVMVDDDAARYDAGKSGGVDRARFDYIVEAPAGGADDSAMWATDLQVRKC